MTDPCQCNWRRLQYCWLCEDDFTDYHDNDPEADHRQQNEDNDYLADLEEGAYSETGELEDSTPLIETAQRVEQDTADYLQELIERLGLKDMPMAIPAFDTL